jgi:ribosomal protein S18 acetylase RimI-like enzyme
MSLLIRKATLAEANIVQAIMMEAFEPYRFAEPPTSALNETVHSVRNAMERGETAILCFQDGEAVGSVRCLIKEGLYFHRLAVRCTEQGRGVGTALVRWLEDEARRTGQDVIWLKVRSSQTRNVEWYRRLGYLPSTESEDVNPNGQMVRTVRMFKTLPS